MTRELPTWAVPAKDRRGGRTWPTDLARLMRGWRWGRRARRPETAPEPSDRPLRRRRLTRQPSPTLWLLRERLIVHLAGADHVVGVEPPVVIVSNHPSVLDFRVLKATLPRA